MKRLLDIIKGLSGLFLICGIICNCFLSYRVFNISRSASVVVQTNFVSTVDLPSQLPNRLENSLSNSTFNIDFREKENQSSPPLPQKVAEYPYQYFLIARRIGAKMFNRYYYEGSPCSYGRIRYIYPDRIILENGDWIQNRMEQLALSSSDSNERTSLNVSR